MKKMNYFICIIIFIFAGSSVFAQNEQDAQLDSLFFESETQEVEKPSAQYFGFGGGVIADFHFINFDEINKLTADKYGFEKLESPMFVYGGGGFTSTIIVPNLRAGFFGAAGSKLVEKTVDNVKKSIEYSLSYGFLKLDYQIILSKAIVLCPGVDFGWGGITMEYASSNAEKDWGNLTPESDTSNYMHRIDANMVYIQPNLAAEITLTPFFTLRVAAGYPITFMGDWYYNREAKLNNVPDKVNGNGLTLQVGAMFGVFNIMK